MRRRSYGFFFGALSGRVGLTQVDAQQVFENSDPSLSSSWTVLGYCGEFIDQPLAISATVSPLPSAASFASPPPSPEPLICVARALILAPFSIRYMMTSSRPINAAP